MASAGRGWRVGKSTVYFLLTIDTEEDHAWSLDFKPHTELTTENIRYLPDFQAFCNELGIRPTYLIAYPVAVNPEAVSILKRLLQEGHCEVGAHLHPWCNPPYEEERHVRNSFLNNLPPDLQMKKLYLLTHTIEEQLGVRPVSYRAGRYGFDASTVPVLERLGYRVDSSVVPYRRARYPYEPAFPITHLHPYPLNQENVCQVGNSPILEVPITVGFTRNIPEWLKRVYPNLPRVGIRKLLRTTTGLDLVWLRPSYASLNAMLQLAKTVIQSGVPVLNMMFHSSELMPGASPYNQHKADVSRFLEKIRQFVQEITAAHSVQFITLSETYPIFYKTA